MREIKFQFIYKGLPFSSNNCGFNWHKKVYTMDQLLKKPLRNLADIHAICELVAKRQFIGISDKNGVEVFEGDILKVCCSGYPDEIHTVFWAGPEYPAFELSYWGGEANGLSEINLGDNYSFEVIGNIHESPELLNKG